MGRPSVVGREAGVGLEAVRPAAAARGLAALLAGAGREVAVLREGPLFAGDGRAALPRDLAPALRVHCGETAPGAGLSGGVGRHAGVPSLDAVERCTLLAGIIRLL